MPAATRFGDADVPHCSGMTRAQGSPNVMVNGRPWSCKDHVNTIHRYFPLLPPCLKHTMPIAKGSITVIVNNKGAGRFGDQIASCTSVAEGSPNVFAGGGGGAVIT